MDKLKIPPKTTLIYSAVIFLLILVNITLLSLVLKEKPPKVVKECVSETSTEDQTSEDADDVSEDHPCRDFRLPKHTLPLHYDIILYPNMQNDTFQGKVDIMVNITKETNHIIFHSHSMTNITTLSVFGRESDAEIALKKTFPYIPNSYYVIDTSDKLQTGIYMIKLKFHSKLMNKGIGLFKSNYINSRNENRGKYLPQQQTKFFKFMVHKNYLNMFVDLDPMLLDRIYHIFPDSSLYFIRNRSFVASKFQPIFARHAFPCFDEPGFKSVFSISLVHTPDYFALSNMPVEIVQPFDDNGLVITKFQRSVPMVTYLAEFIICDFKFTRTMSTKGKPMRVYTTPDKINQTQHALIFGRRVLDYLEYYFGVEYPLPKYDMISFPTWSSGATEHWGIVTFPDNNLLYDEEKTAPYSMQKMTTIISHETVHMWFGNLVTAEWWEDIWLHEGFASYLEYLGIQELHPDWDLMSQFVLEDMVRAIDMDASAYSSPIIKKADHASGIFFTFRGTTYPKGATILRMIESFMGKETFRSGISNFLKKYEYKNVKTSDLWDELSAVYKIEGNHTFASLMKSWTEGVGIPYVTIKRQGDNFVVKQKRFFDKEALNRKRNPDDKEKILWSIPISYKSTNGQTGIKWIHDSQEKFTLPVLANETLKFNIDHTGYYIVNYERQDWDKLVHLLVTNHEALSVLDRSNLIMDAIYLAEAVHMNFDTLLSLTKYLKNEKHYVPWKAVYRILIALCRKLEFTDVDILCKNYIYSLTEQIYQKTEWKRTKNHLENLLRPVIIELACYSENRHCLNKATEMFQNWTQGQSILTELKYIVIPVGMAEIGRDEQFTYLLDRFSKETDEKMQLTYLRAFAEIKIPHLIQRFLQHLIEKNDSNIFMDYLKFASYDAYTRSYILSILEVQWPSIKESFQNEYFTSTRAISVMSTFMSSDLELDKAEDFLHNHQSKYDTLDDINREITRIVQNIKWRETYMDDIKLWFIEEGVSRFKH